jgi:hypothetical protein
MKDKSFEKWQKALIKKGGFTYEMYKACTVCEECDWFEDTEECKHGFAVKKVYMVEGPNEYIYIRKTRKVCKMFKPYSGDVESGVKYAINRYFAV